MSWVALGYSQIPIVDFSDNFAPMVNDTTFHLMLSRKLIENLLTRIIDEEMAFLYGELEDKIYMNHQQVMLNVTMKLKKTKYLYLTRAYLV